MGRLIEIMPGIMYLTQNTWNVSGNSNASLLIQIDKVPYKNSKFHNIAK